MMKSSFVLFVVTLGVIALATLTAISAQQTTNKVTVNINTPQPQPFGMFTVDFTFDNKVSVTDTNLALVAPNPKRIDFISTIDVQRPFEASVAVKSDYGNCSPCYYENNDDKIASFCVASTSDATQFKLTQFVDIEAQQIVRCTVRHGAYIVAGEEDAVKLQFVIITSGSDLVKYELTGNSNVVYSTLQNVDETTPKFLNTKFTRRLGPVYGGYYPGPLSVLEFTVSNIPSGAFYGIDIGELGWGDKKLGSRSLTDMMEPEFMVSTEWKCTAAKDNTARLHFTPQPEEPRDMYGNNMMLVPMLTIATTKDHNPTTPITCQIPIPLQEVDN
eukprot:UN01808